jgi:phage shock protein PspC (stress-responsive transcriptional regulator)
MSTKKLYRNQEEAKLLGVIAGISDFTSVDVGLLRLIFLGVTIATAVIPGMAFYFIAAIVLDPKPTDN